MVNKLNHSNLDDVWEQKNVRALSRVAGNSLPRSSVLFLVLVCEDETNDYLYP